jgi:hypothetical protein
LGSICEGGYPRRDAVIGIYVRLPALYFAFGVVVALLAEIAISHTESSLNVYSRD